MSVQFFLHNVTEPRPQDPDMPVIPVEPVKPKISLVPFISALRKYRYIHIRHLYIWGIVLTLDDIVSLVSVHCVTGECTLSVYLLALLLSAYHKKARALGLLKAQLVMARLSVIPTELSYQKLNQLCFPSIYC